MENYGKLDINTKAKEMVWTYYLWRLLDLHETPTPDNLNKNGTQLNGKIYPVAGADQFFLENSKLG